MNLTDNTILITGGGSGIGLALAQAFVEKQNTVIICGRDEGKLAIAAGLCPGVITKRVDLGNAGDLAQFARTLREEFPSFNCLINNAGIQHAIALCDSTKQDDKIREEIEINLTAPIALTHLLLPQLLAQDCAAIVNVTSALAIAPKRSAPIYCTTKAAMRMFTRVLRYQLREQNVRVFEVVPALVKTAMTVDRGPQHMISPQRVADDVLAGMARNREEILIERARALWWLHRWWPNLAFRLLASH